MEILCVMAALAALFLGSAALTLKARVPAGLAPLVTLSCIVAVLTLAGMAGVLYPAAWAVYALCAAGGVWALLPPKAILRAIGNARQRNLLGAGTGLCRVLLRAPAHGHGVR